MKSLFINYPVHHYFLEMKPITIIFTVFAVTIVAYFIWTISNFSFDIGRKVAVVTNHNIVLEKIEQLGKLELVKYKFKDIVEHKIEYDYYPDSKVVLIVSGEAVGCIDLKKIKLSDINQKNKDSLYIRLPEPELCYNKIDQSASRIYDTKHGINDAADLMGGAYKAAEKQIERTALESNILEQTKKNGEQLLKPLLENISGKKVFFTYSPTGDAKLKKK